MPVHWVIRFVHGTCSLIEELRLEDVAAFKNFARVEPDMFAEIVERVSHIIWKQDTSYRKALEPGLKVALTLRHLATGGIYHSLMYGFRVPSNTICKFVPEVCEDTVAEYSPKIISSPTTPDEWRPIAEQNCSTLELPSCRWSPRWKAHCHHLSQASRFELLHLQTVPLDHLDWTGGRRIQVLMGGRRQHEIDRRCQRLQSL